MVMEPEPMASIIVPAYPVNGVLARFGWNFGRIWGQFGGFGEGGCRQGQDGGGMGRRGLIGNGVGLYRGAAGHGDGYDDDEDGEGEVEARRPDYQPAEQGQAGVGRLARRRFLRQAASPARPCPTAARRAAGPAAFPASGG